MTRREDAGRGRNPGVGLTLQGGALLLRLAAVATLKEGEWAGLYFLAESFGLTMLAPQSGH